MIFNVSLSFFFCTGRWEKNALTHKPGNEEAAQSARCARLQHFIFERLNERKPHWIPSDWIELLWRRVLCWNVTMARTNRRRETIRNKASQELCVQHTLNTWSVLCVCVYNTARATDYDSNSKNQVTSCANVLRFDHNSYAYSWALWRCVRVCLWTTELNGCV